MITKHKRPLRCLTRAGRSDTLPIAARYQVTLGQILGLCQVAGVSSWSYCSTSGGATQWFLCQFSKFLGLREGFEGPSGTLGLGSEMAAGGFAANHCVAESGDAAGTNDGDDSPVAHVSAGDVSGPLSRAEPSRPLAPKVLAKRAEAGLWAGAPPWVEAPWAEVP